MRLVEFTTDRGETFSITPSALQIWPAKNDHNKIVLYIGQHDASDYNIIKCTYQEAVDKINAALEPERVPAAKTWKVQTIGEAIRRMRRIAGLMQGELASHVECVPHYIPALEENNRNTTSCVIELICRVTNCSLTVTGDGFEVQERGDNG
jgi:hypothetical protein